MEFNTLTKAVGHNDLYITRTGEAYHIRKVTLGKKTSVDGKHRRLDEYYSGELFSRIMAKTFLSNPEDLPQVDHIDTDTMNNNINNLQWITNAANSAKQSFNKKHRYKGIEYDKDREQYRGYFHTKENGKRKRHRTARYETREEAAEARLDLIKNTKGHILEKFRLQ